jgi:hypothetical protein
LDFFSESNQFAMSELKLAKDEQSEKGTSYLSYLPIYLRDFFKIPTVIKRAEAMLANGAQPRQGAGTAVGADNLDFELEYMGCSPWRVLWKGDPEGAPQGAPEDHLGGHMGGQKDGLEPSGSNGMSGADATASQWDEEGTAKLARMARMARIDRRTVQ